MKKLLCAVLVLASCSFATADDKNLQTYMIRNSFASEKITVTGTAIGFTAATIAPTGATQSNHQVASAASCTLETADIRILTVGTPTATTGLYVATGGAFTVYGYNDISHFLAIRVGSTSGVLNCAYYR